MKVIVALMVAAATATAAAALAATTSGSDNNEKQQRQQIVPEVGTTASEASAARQLQSGTTQLTSGYLNIILGSSKACMPVSGIIRVRLGVCAQQPLQFFDVDGALFTAYSMQYLQKTGNSYVWVSQWYTDAACTAVLQVSRSSPNVATVDGGCSYIRNGFPQFAFPSLTVSTSNINFNLYVPAYATVTYDAGYDAFPATSSVPASWYTFSIYANAAACAQPTSNPPIFTYAYPLAIMASCPVNAACVDTSGIATLNQFGPSGSQGCVTVTPQATGYRLVSQGTGQQVIRDTHSVRHDSHAVTNAARPRPLFPPFPPVDPQCTGSISASVASTALGQCFAGTALAGFSPAGVTKVTNTLRSRDGGLAYPPTHPPHHTSCLPLFATGVLPLQRHHTIQHDGQRDGGANGPGQRVATHRVQRRDVHHGSCDQNRRVVSVHRLLQRRSRRGPPGVSRQPVLLLAPKPGVHHQLDDTFQLGGGPGAADLAAGPRHLDRHQQIHDRRQLHGHKEAGRAALLQRHAGHGPDADVQRAGVRGACVLRVETT